jgi:hypothetical protein
MKLVWNDEFNNAGKPDNLSWRYETGFVRNQELQWYQEENANCANGGDPSKTRFPIKYEVDYVRVYQNK